MATGTIWICISYLTRSGCREKSVHVGPLTLLNAYKDPFGLEPVGLHSQMQNPT